MEPIPMLIWCPECGSRHIDEGEFATKPHHTHACQHCGHCWRPALIATCGVKFLPGFKNEATPMGDTRMDFQKWWAQQGHVLWRDKAITSQVARAAWAAATEAERERCAVTANTY